MGFEDWVAGFTLAAIAIEVWRELRHLRKIRSWRARDWEWQRVHEARMAAASRDREGDAKQEPPFDEAA